MTARTTVLPTRNLDILRAVAVLSVLFGHLLAAQGISLPHYARELMGRFGVLLFFVHTSLVLMASLERQGTARSDWVRAFYVRRAFRIYPLAIVTVAIAALLAIPEHVGLPPVPPTPLTPGVVASNMALSQNLFGNPNILGVLWSLPIEVQMYVLLPFYFLVANRRSRDMALLVAGTVLAGMLVIRAGDMRGVSRLWVLAFAPCFASGVMAYHLLKRGVRPSIAAWAWPALIVVCGALVLGMNQTYRHPQAGWIPCLLLGACIPFIRDAHQSAVTDVAHRICDVSYGIYLLHEPILWLSFVVLRGLPTLAQWIAFVALIVALPTIAYRYLEQPGIRLGQRLTHQLANRLAEVGAP